MGMRRLSRTMGAPGNVDRGRSASFRFVVGGAFELEAFELHPLPTGLHVRVLVPRVGAAHDKLRCEPTPKPHQHFIVTPKRRCLGP